MAKNKAKNKTNKAVVAAEIGAGIAAAAAAGYYFYASKDAKKHRKLATRALDGFKKEVIREAKKLKAMDADDIADAIDTAVVAYKGVRSIKREDLNRAAKELKANWEQVKREAKTGAEKSTATAKKAMKTVRKAAKKMPTKRPTSSKKRK